MRTLRLLFWLRVRIGMNTTGLKGRWAAAGVTLLFALAMSPFYVGGAIAAHTYARGAGAPALLVVFGCVQLAILWVSLLTGAMGRTFELDKLKRYPLRPITVFIANTLASFTEPIMVMALPSVLTAAVGVGQHSGLRALAEALMGGLLLLFVSAALIQLLLALLDDLLRREWMRYVAALFFTLTIVGFQVAVSGGTRRFMASAKQPGLTAERLSDEAMRIFERVPTIAGPAAVAGAHRAGPFESPYVGLASCAALIALSMGWGGRLMASGATRGAPGGGSRARSGSASRGGITARIPGLSAVQSVLVARELRYLLRTPSLLYQMAIIPLTAIGLTFVGRSSDTQFSAFMPMFLLVSSLAGRNLMLWGYDGPGVRTLFLLPFRTRDLVLSKNLAWMASALLEATIVFAWMTVRSPATIVPQLPMLASGYLATLFAGSALGTWVSISKPVKPPQQGMARRSPGGLIGLGAVLVLLLLAGAIIVTVLGARSVAPAEQDLLASTVVTLAFMAAAAAVWWIALERNADLLEVKREGMIDVLAKSVDA
ncbi:MAG: hypothetical protein ABL977_02580 [Candidatus Eisenbacteria bacterium]